jgi:DNA-directed RNA polymerase subunit H (RpoH/RPB5)
MENFLKSRRLLLFRRIGVSPDDDDIQFTTNPHAPCKQVTHQSHPTNSYLPASLVHSINIYQVVSMDNDTIMQLLYYHDPKGLVNPVSIGKADIRRISLRLPVCTMPMIVYLMVPTSLQAIPLAETHGFEVVPLDLFRFLRTLSRMIPTYTIIDDPQLLIRLKCTREDLPRILLSDPVVRINGWKKDTIIYANESDTYRLVTA